MAEELNIPNGTDREELYRSLLPQIEALIGDETDQQAIMANVCAALRQAFGFFWVGFYRVENGQLVLGPFQGDVACFRINKGSGVCGTAWEKAETIIVPDVEQFPGHIACSAASRSEIVVPMFNENEVVAVMDVDSDKLNDFSEVDKIWLEKLAQMCQKRFNTQ